MTNKAQFPSKTSSIYTTVTQLLTYVPQYYYARYAILCSQTL